MVIFLNETQKRIQLLMKALQSYRSFLNDGSDAASQASLHDLMRHLHRELDLIEAEILAKSASIGLHFDGLPPVSYYLKKFRNRLTLHFRNCDSAVAESMIRCATDWIITISRVMNETETADPVTEQLYQRLHWCFNMSLRHFKSYL